MQKQKQPLSLQPELVHFVQGKQMLKITNRTNQNIDNCFFCLYNTNKYEFMPENFGLKPKESKIVTVTLKIRGKGNTKEQSKEFAYLKAKNVNKRITLINGDNQDRFRTPGEGHQDINTLSSRQYRQTQKAAYQRLINQKQSYIKNLQKKLQQSSPDFPTPHQASNTKYYLDQIHSLQLKISLLETQNQQLLHNYLGLEQKFTSYRVLTEGDHRFLQMNTKIEEYEEKIQKQERQIVYLEGQCEQFLSKMERMEKEQIERDREWAFKCQQIQSKAEERVKDIETRKNDEKKKFEQDIKEKEETIRNKYENEIKNMEQILAVKQKQKKSLSSQVQQCKKTIKQFEIQSKKSIKIQLQKQTLQQKNSELKSTLKNLQKSYSQLKQQSIIHKNRLQDHNQSTQKITQYLKLALQSSKTQNQTLTKSLTQLQSNFSQQVKTRKIYEQKCQNLTVSLSQKDSQLKENKEKIRRMQEEKEKEDEKNYEKMMEIKKENVQLLEKIQVEGKRERERQIEKEETEKQFKDLKGEINKKQRQIQNIVKRNLQLERQLEQLKQKLRDAQESKQKINKKIEKYRKQAKKSIKSISQNAKDELKRIQQQKNKLQKKVYQLQQLSANNTEHPHLTSPQLDPQLYTKSHSNSHHGHPHPHTHAHPHSHHPHLQRTGIRNQRRQLQESQANSQHNSQMQREGLDKVYGELGQLREFRVYVCGAIDRVQAKIGENRPSRDRVHDRDRYGYDENYGGNIIFLAINFFKQLQKTLQSKPFQQQSFTSAQKQIHFLKGRLAQLQSLSQAKATKQISPDSTSASALAFLRQQMLSQYKKLSQSLKISEQKYNILKKKIYEEYRARIIELMNKGKKGQFQNLGRLEVVIERFVEGLGNMSHKQAILAKELKLKNQARREVGLLKEKLQAIARQIQRNKDSKENKKGVSNCVRDTTKLLQINNQNQWIDHVRTQAKMLTYQAQNAKLLLDSKTNIQTISQLQSQITTLQSDLSSLSQQRQSLKNQLLALTKQHKEIHSKQTDQLQKMKAKFIKMEKMEKQIADLTIKEKENGHLRKQLEEKREIVKNMREREKMMEMLLQGGKNQVESRAQKRDRERTGEEIRMQEALRDLTENNRELRIQNTKYKEQINQLIQEMNKKNSALKRLKSQSQQFRIKNVKSQQMSLQKLRSQVRQLKQQLKKQKQQTDKLKRKKQRQLSQKHTDFQKIRSQFAIQRSSLQSIIRALTDTIKGIYCQLDIIARKKGKIMNETVSDELDQYIGNPAEIKSTRVRQFFEEVIEAVKD